MVRLDERESVHTGKDKGFMEYCQSAIAFVNVWSPTMTSALIGASSVKQLEANVAALKNLEFDEQALQAIDRLAPQ